MAIKNQKAGGKTMIWRTMISRKWVLTTILVIAGTVLCIRLGIWQLDRLAQRKAFNAHYLETSSAAPLSLNSLSTDNLTQQEYRLVSAVGIYDPTNNIVLRNQYHDNQPGYFLITPLVLSDGTAVLIERGWIPAEGNSTPADWKKYDQPGTVEIKGIIRLGQTKPDVGGVPDPELTSGQSRLDFWNLINLDRISKQVPYKLLPIFIQPNPDPEITVPPYPYQPAIEISEGPHLSYAIQWFSFACILFFGYPFFLRRQQNLGHATSQAESNS